LICLSTPTLKLPNNNQPAPFGGQLVKECKMKDFILGGLLGFVIVAFVISVYGFRIGVYTL
jgi:hypothetical protein